MMKVRRALISVSNKAGVVGLGRELNSLGIEVLSSGGTFKTLRDGGVEAVRVSDVTGFPEILDGRVKTLHPRIHGGILADRSKPEHLEELKAKRIRPIDLVVVNLYPFEKTVAKRGVEFEEAIENIDIGGPTLIRAAAKNCAHVAVVVNPRRYRSVAAELKRNGGSISPSTSMELAREAFRHTCLYDAAIFGYLSGEAEFPDGILLPFDKVQDLRYGENPHQRAAFYRSSPPVRGSFASARQLHGRELSFNNLADGDASLSLVREFHRPAAVIIKHNNPCGTAEGRGLLDAYRAAHRCDPVSAFGSVVGFNRVVDSQVAKELSRTFIELVVAPAFRKGALEILRKKEDIRLLEIGKGGQVTGSEVVSRWVEGGLLLQEPDREFVRRSRIEVVTRKKPTRRQWEDLLFGWKVAKHVWSNAIVLAGGSATVGIGAGQMSRVDAVEIAISKAGKRTGGSVLASDAFFPFPDGVERAAAAGVKALIQPGGSVRDEEVIEVADAHGIAMVFTGRRHFRH